MASSTITLVHHITQEEYNLFHAIDRRLFSILVFSLGRDPTDAIRVMALWLWLERITLKSTIVHVILSLPYPTIDTLFDESMLCLHAAAYGPIMNSHVSTLNTLLRGKNIDVSLKYFHENNVVVLHGVGRVVEDVCVRAFRDIVARLKTEGSIPHANHGGFDFDAYNFGTVSNDYDEINEFAGDSQDEVDELFAKMNYLNIDGKNIVEDRLGECREINGRGSNNKTLFLTFSKGYPISKSEVREFFSRLFGDIIEGLHMQEVEKNEQPLYARLVVRDVSMVNLVLQGHKKIKFSINGKHACVRKYVRRRSESPPTPPGLE